MKYIKSTFILLIFILLICVSCFRIDTQDFDNAISSEKQNSQSEFPDYPYPLNKTVSGIDYKLSQMPVGEFGGEFVTSDLSDPKTFNPWVAKDATSSAIGDMLYDSLLVSAPQSADIMPALAKSYEISDDKMTYTINLRHGLRWSDGKEITADDVYFTWNDIIFAGFGNTSTRDSVVINGKLPEIKVIDKYTVKFITPEPFAPFLRFLGAPIAPKHVFQDVVKKGTKYFDSYLSSTTNPKDIVSSGAFLLDEYVPAQRIVFKRNPNYYLINSNAQKLPYIDRYIILIVGDINNAILKFESKELDILSVNGKDVSRLKRKEKKSDYTLYDLGPSANTNFIVFNLNRRQDKNGNYFVTDYKQKWFNDVNFRTAVDFAIDREGMIINIANGIGTSLFTAESIPSVFLYKELAKGHSQDIDFAKELLKKSGFYLDKNGLLHDKDNHIVEIDLITNAGNTEREACGVIVKEDLAKLGIKVNFRPIEFNSLVNKVSYTNQWEMIILGFSGGSIYEPHSGKNVWYSKGAMHIFNNRLPDGNNSDILPWEKELDDIFEAGALELNFDKRKKIYDRYQQIIYDEKPFVYLYTRNIITALRNKIKNAYLVRFSGGIYNIEEIYVKN